MGRRQALAEFHRGSILAAAERLFSERGVDGTTMDDIAREAEYSKATLYVYFQSKEEIVGAILLNGLAILKKRVRQAIEKCEQWPEAYQAVCQGIVDFYRENPTAYEAVMGGNSSSAGSIKGDQDIRRSAGELYEELADFFARGISPERNRMETVIFFWTSISGVIHMADQNETFLREHVGKSREEFLQDGFGMIFQAITRA